MIEWKTTNKNSARIFGRGENMELVNNESLFAEIETGLERIRKDRTSDIILSPFTKDFSLRFCWSSNAIEGNTLSLDETISLIEYDEVRAGHTYTEYHDAKNLYQAIQELLVPFQRQQITEEWIKKANGIILGKQGEYRKGDVYIGSLAEVVYYPPEPERVPELMQRFFEKWENTGKGKNLTEIVWQLAEQHIEFEQIHPFQDGNGRIGRMLMNQELMNQDLLPIAINPTGKYRQAFQRYEKKGDLSLMIRQICKAEIEAIQRIQCLVQRREQSRQQSSKKS